MLDKIKNMISEEETEFLETDEIILDDTFEMNSKKTPTGKRNVIKIYTPVSKISSEKIMDSIKKRELCVVNFKNLNEEEGNQVLNQLSGTIYALDGQMIQMTGEIVICAPKNYLLSEENN